MLKVRIHKLTNDKFQTCYLDPKTGNKKRNQFDSLREAKDKKNELELRFATMGISAFSNDRVGTLMKLHLDKVPTSKVATNKKFFRAFMEKFGSFRISQLTRGDLYAFFWEYKTEHNLSEKTLNCFKIYLMHFMYFLVNENIVTVNPLQGIKFKKNVPSTRPRIVLSVAEVETLIANAFTHSPTVLYPFLYSLAHTGARKSEMLKLKREHVDFETGVINLLQTKNGSDRGVKMAPKLEEFLRAHLASHSSEYVFINKKKQRFGREQLARAIKRFKHHFPMEKNWTLHALRHSLANNFLKAGGEMYQLQAILGHRHIGTTVDTYGQIAAQDVNRPSPYNF